MDDVLLNSQPDDKSLGEEIRDMAAKQIKAILLLPDQQCLPHELKLKYEILRAIGPSVVPKLNPDLDIPTEETKLTAEQQEHLNKILNYGEQSGTGTSNQGNKTGA